MKKIFSLLFLFIILACGCIKQKKEVKQKMEEVELKLTSPAFEEGGKIPEKYTCDGEDVSPPLKIGGAPENTESLALIVDDPDAPAGTWVHWVVWNIAPEISEIKQGEVPGTQGINDFKKHDYGGPCPPSGEHRYFFKLYALDTKLDISENSQKGDLLNAMKGHILGKVELRGSYSR